jgi:hypothetical protein
VAIVAVAYDAEATSSRATWHGRSVRLNPIAALPAFLTRSATTARQRRHVALGRRAAARRSRSTTRKRAVKRLPRRRPASRHTQVVAALRAWLRSRAAALWRATRSNARRFRTAVRACLDVMFLVARTSRNSPTSRS